MSFTTKYSVASQIKTRILDLSIQEEGKATLPWGTLRVLGKQNFLFP